MQILLPASGYSGYLYRQQRDCPTDSQSLHAGNQRWELYYGPLSDKYGRKPVMLIGLSITFGSLACLFADSIEFLILGRFVQAFGGAVGLAGSRHGSRRLRSERCRQSHSHSRYGDGRHSNALTRLRGADGKIWYWQSVFSVVACFSVVLFVVMLICCPKHSKRVGSF